MLEHLSEDQIRAICKKKIESLEHWLRRLIDGQLRHLGDYINFSDEHGNFLLRKSVRETAAYRKLQEPERYPRLVDTLLLEEEIDIICVEHLYNKYFKSAFAHAYPNGREVTKTFLNKIVSPRNSLAHANAVSQRSAEQLICYCDDIIDSIKHFYTTQNMSNQFNVPTILKVINSFGAIVHRNEMIELQVGMVYSFEKNNYELRPGETFSIEVEVDPSFNDGDYYLQWGIPNRKMQQGNIKKVTIELGVKDTSAQFIVHINVISNKEWHRHSNGSDDTLYLTFRILPPN